MAAMIDPVHIQLAAEQWIKAYERRPKTTVVVTVCVVIALATAIFFVDRAEREKREALRLKTASYEAQIKQLNDTEKYLRELLSFVDSQRGALRATEDAISALQKEKARLEPIVASDRAAVEALFRAQEERNRSGVWFERAFGFISGVVASLIAAFIWSVAAKLSQRRKGRSL